MKTLHRVGALSTVPIGSVHSSASCSDRSHPDSLGGNVPGGSPELQKANGAPDTMGQVPIAPVGLGSESEGDGQQVPPWPARYISGDMNRHVTETRHLGNCGTRCGEERQH